MRKRNWLSAGGVLAALVWHAAPVQAQSLYVGSYGTGQVERYSVNGTFQNSLAPDNNAGLSGPMGIAIGPDSAVYVSSGDTDSVLRYNSATDAFQTFIPSGSGGLGSPAGLTFGPDGDLYVASDATDSVLRYDGTTGAFLGSAAAVSVPMGLTFGPDGSLYVVGYGADTIERFSAVTGIRDTTFTANVADPTDLTFGADGTLYVTSGSEVDRFSGVTGAALGAFVPDGSGGLSTAYGLTFGPASALYVSSYDTDSVLRYDAGTGNFLGSFVSAGSGGLSGPIFLRFAAAPEPTAPMTLGLAGLMLLGLNRVARRGEPRRRNERLSR